MINAPPEMYREDVASTSARSLRSLGAGPSLATAPTSCNYLIPRRVGIWGGRSERWLLLGLLSGTLMVEGCGSMSDFDEGVILRAHRFRAEMAGYRLEREHYMDGEDDRADRWYVVPASRKVSAPADRTGPGFRSAAAAADEAERLAGKK